ncbi:MAG: RNA polymerase sigma factor [Flavobacteriaceae bacterium]
MSKAEFYHIFNNAMGEETTDLFLIERLKSGDKNAMFPLYDKYSGALFGVIVRMCRDRELAEDLLQESFIRIWEKIDTYEPDRGKFYTWAYRISRNTTLNHLRKSSPLIQQEDLSVYKDREDDMSNESSDQLYGVIKKLDAHHQKAINLVYFMGHTHQEAHQIMDVPLGTFKSYIRQALLKLRTIRSELYFILIAIEVLANG